MTTESRELVNKLEGSTFFKVRFSTFSEQEANNLLHRGKCDLVLQIPSGFGKETGKGNPGRILVSVNAINAVNAQLSWAYLNGVIRDYNMNIVARKYRQPALWHLSRRYRLPTGTGTTNCLIINIICFPGYLEYLFWQSDFFLQGLIW